MDIVFRQTFFATSQPLLQWFLRMRGLCGGGGFSLTHLSSPLTPVLYTWSPLTSSPLSPLPPHLLSSPATSRVPFAGDVCSDICAAHIASFVMWGCWA